MEGKLTIRQRQILGILNSQKDRISGREIAEYLDVTDRTVRTDIQVLADFLRPLGAEIDAVRGKGYLLKSHDASQVQSFVYQADTLLTPEDRIRILTMILLESADPVQIDDLAEECFVSRSTIEHDLKVIAFEFEKEQPNIRLIRRKHTVAFERNEWKRRYVMNLLYVRRWNFNYEAGIHMADLPVSDAEMTLIEESLTAAQGEYGLSLTEYDHVSFLFSAAIAIRRIRMGFPMETSTAGGTARTRAAVERILQNVERSSGLSFSDLEKSALSDELSFRVQYKEEHAVSFFRNNGQSSYGQLILDVLGEMDRCFGSSFSASEELKGELLYLLLTQAHNPYHTGLRDEYVIRRVRTECPDAVDMICHFDEALRKRGGKKLTENYLFELVASMASAIEEESVRKREVEGIPVMIISHMTTSATKVLMTQIRSFFGTRVSLLGPIPVHEAVKRGCGRADLAVASTKMKPLDRSLPYLTIPRMMDKHQLERLNCLISLENYRKLYPGGSRFIITHLSHFEVLRERNAGSRGELLRKLSGKVLEEKLAGEAFMKAVFAREQQTSTAFREGFALPHALYEGAETNGLLLVSLDSPIDWGGIMVEQIVLLLLKAEKLPWQMRIYSCLAYMLRRVRAQKLLQSIEDGPSLQTLLTEIERHG